jgi:CHASE3 domain sensor protein
MLNIVPLFMIGEIITIVIVGVIYYFYYVSLKSTTSKIHKAH